MVEDRKKSCGVDPDEAIRFLAAEGRTDTQFGTRAGAQIVEALRMAASSIEEIQSREKGLVQPAIS